MSQIPSLLLLPRRRRSRTGPGWSDPIDRLHGERRGPAPGDRDQAPCLKTLNSGGVANAPAGAARKSVHDAREPDHLDAVDPSCL